jgi:hypothetical protein
MSEEKRKNNVLEYLVRNDLVEYLLLILLLTLLGISSMWPIGGGQ